MCRDRCRTSLSFKERFCLLLKFLLPMPDRNRVDPKFLPYLVERFYPSQCLQSYLGLELGSMELSLLSFTHLFLFLGIASSLNYCLKTGVHYKAPMIKAQHPDYELYTTGLHYSRGVSCSDCHMPETEDGVADHAVSNPITHIKQSCLGCHKQTEEELKAILEIKYNRKEQLNQIAMTTLATAHLEAGKAWEVGATEAEMEEVLQLLRSGQWFWDYAIASHGGYIHAPEETLRVLGIAIDKGSQARIKLAGTLAKYGVIGYEVPDFSTKEKAQKLAGVDLEKEIKAKIEFRNTLFKEWTDSAIKNGYLDPKQREGLSDNTSYKK